MCTHGIIHVQQFTRNGEANLEQRLTRLARLGTCSPVPGRAQPAARNRLARRLARSPSNRPSGRSTSPSRTGSPLGCCTDARRSRCWPCSLGTGRFVSRGRSTRWRLDRSRCRRSSKLLRCRRPRPRRAAPGRPREQSRPERSASLARKVAASVRGVTTAHVCDVGVHCAGMSCGTCAYICPCLRTKRTPCRGFYRGKMGEVDLSFQAHYSFSVEQ